MLLTIDIGNTNVTCGIFREAQLVKTWRMESDARRTPDEYAIMLIAMLEHDGIKTADINQVSMCSTVPAISATFQELCQKYLNTEPLVVGAGVKTGVKIRMDNPREVGPDRIVHAAAAHHLYGGPLIVIDMGTATTFDTVSKEGDYLGGAIAPGFAISADALVTRTSMLPRVDLVRPKLAIGTSTVAAMQSGIIFGYIGLIEGIVGRIQKELGAKATVIATGGHSRMIANETSVINIVNPDLILIGLRLIYDMNRS